MLPYAARGKAMTPRCTPPAAWPYISFDYAEKLSTSDGKPVRTFEVAGDDGLFYPAQAVVENGKIKVWSDKVKEPETVRYGWQPFTRANLVNGAGLPASTFRAE